MFRYLSRTLRDILSPPVLSFVLKVGMASFLFWIFVLAMFWSQFEKLVASYISMIPYIGSSGWVQEGGAFMLAIVAGYTLVVLTVSIATSLLSEKLLISLARREYPSVAIAGSASIHRSIYHTVKASLLFVILFLLTFPLLFVPVLGQIVMLWLWSVLLKEPTLYDVGSLFVKDEKVLLERASKARIAALVAALFNYLPIVNIFAPLCAQILIMHFLLSDADRLRS